MIRERTEVVLFRVNKKTGQEMYLKTIVDNNLNILKATWTEYFEGADIFPSIEVFQKITKYINLYDFENYDYGYWTTIVEEVR